jgi:molybdate-binding protein/DNA-binding XRE family transcriptional regulator
MPRTNHVRTRRIDTGLAQVELARRAGISRQALLAIESHHAVPSVDVAMRLGRALGTTVDALFGRDTDDARTVDVRARSGRVVMARIGERWIAHALGRGDETSADAIVREGRATFLRDPEGACDNVVVVGCAPILASICDRLNGAHARGRYAWLGRSSRDALAALRERRAHVAGFHVEARTGRARVVPLARWEVGLVVAKGNPLRVRRASDVFRRGVRLVTRERGSGARRMFERALVAEGASASRAASNVVACGHREVAQCVAMGACDVGPAVRDVAIACDLDFVPLGVERFDLAVAPGMLDDARVARFFDALASMPVRRELASRGYEVA